MVQLESRTTAHAVSRRLLTMRARVRLQGLACEIYGVEVRTATGFSPSPWVFPPSISYHHCSVSTRVGPVIFGGGGDQWSVTAVPQIQSHPLMIIYSLHNSQCPSYLNVGMGRLCDAKNFKLSSDGGSSSRNKCK
jgi:hypothetical protein